MLGATVADAVENPDPNGLILAVTEPNVVLFIVDSPNKPNEVSLAGIVSFKADEETFGASGVGFVEIGFVGAPKLKPLDVVATDPNVAIGLMPESLVGALPPKFDNGLIGLGIAFESPPPKLNVELVTEKGSSLVGGSVSKTS